MPRYGTPEPDADGGRAQHDVADGGRAAAALSLQHPDDDSAWAWSDVVDRLEEVRADPKGEIEQAQGRLAAFAGRLDADDAPLRLALDMPTGVGPVGGLPKDLADVVVPPVQSLEHDAEWLDAVSGRGFHDGVLDGLRAFYGGHR
nr:hypothetical protein [Angustibacter aerolatus]